MREGLNKSFSTHPLFHLDTHEIPYNSKIEIPRIRSVLSTVSIHVFLTVIIALWHEWCFLSLALSPRYDS